LTWSAETRPIATLLRVVRNNNAGTLFGWNDIPAAGLHRSGKTGQDTLLFFGATPRSFGFPL
jgi:hypothetical protein